MNGAPLEVSVCIGGAPLRTHSLPPGEFIVAQPGSAFTIKLKNVWHDRICVELKVDGQGTGATQFLTPGFEKTIQGFRMQGGNHVQQFVFAYPPTFEGSASAAPLPGSSAALGALGSITATAWPTKPKSQQQIMKEARSGGPKGAKPEQQAVPEGKKALALGVTVAAGSTVPVKWKPSKFKSDRSGGDLGKVELRYCVPEALKLSNDPAIKAAAEALIAAGPDAAAAAGAAAAGGASSSSAAAASSSAPLSAAASGNAPAAAPAADVKPERKRRGKAKASSEVVELSDDDAPPKLPKVEPPPSNTADAPIDLT